MKKWLTVLLAVLMLGLVCTAGAQGEGFIETKSERLILTIGKRVQPQLYFSSTSLQKAGVWYEISDESIASVNGSGYVTAKAVGECVLKITSRKDASITAELPISVILPVSKLTVAAEKTTLFVGERIQLTCGYSPASASIKEATFSSGNEHVAMVDENGVVTGLARGSVTITAVSKDGSARAKVKLNVEQQPTAVSFEKKEISLVVGHNTQAKATVLPKNVSNGRLNWTSSDEAIATVDKNGRITAHAPGKAIVTASCQADPSVFAQLTVNSVLQAKSVEMDRKQYDVVIGETLQLHPKVLPAETTDKSVTYSVKNSSIASVDANGVVTGLKGGTTTLTITTADGSKRKTSVTIQVIVPVQGVFFDEKGIRVDAGSFMTVTVNTIPADATNKNMTWISSDEKIATVQGDGNKVRVYGHQWGRCELIAVSQEGGYEARVHVNVGSLRRAVVPENLTLSSHKSPYVTLRNRSDMHITRITYTIVGKDVKGNDLQVGRKSNSFTKSLDVDLYPGDTMKLRVDVGNPEVLEKLEYFKFAIITWETTTGYYDNNDIYQYSFTTGNSGREWRTYASQAYKNYQEASEKSGQ